MAVAVGRTFDENCNLSDLDRAIRKLALPRESKASRNLAVYIDFLRNIGFKNHSLEKVDLAHSSVAWALAKKRVCRLLSLSYLLSYPEDWDLILLGLIFPGHFLCRYRVHL